MRELKSAHHWAGYPKRNKEKKKTTHSIELKKNIFFTTNIMDTGIHNQIYRPLWPTLIYYTLYIRNRIELTMGYEGGRVVHN